MKFIIQVGLLLSLIIASTFHGCQMIEARRAVVDCRELEKQNAALENDLEATQTYLIRYGIENKRAGK